MGCCLDLLEMRLYQVVLRVKNQHRTGNVGDPPIQCHTCTGSVVHELVKKQFLGIIVRVSCPQCGWKFEG